MKKFLAITLTLVLCLGLSVPALADAPEGWTPADGARLGEPVDNGDGTATVSTPDALPEAVDAPIPAQYGATVTVDGKEVDFTGIPGAPAGYIPMRAVTEAAEGFADYYPDDNQALFFLDNVRFIVDFATMTLSVDFEDVDATPYLDPAGYTFLPASVLNGQGAIVVNTNPELDVERYDIVTSASDPTNQLVNAIREAVDSAAGSKTSLEDLVEYMGFHAENYTSIVAYLPMMINADTVIVADVAEGKLDAAKEDLQARLDTTIQNFEHYLPDAYDMAKNGQVVESPDGAHLMLIISGDNAAAIELFNAAYPAAE